MADEDELAKQAFERDAAEYDQEHPTTNYLDDSWLNLRLYLRQDNGLWLINDSVSYHPLFLSVNLDEYKLMTLEATGLIRAAYNQNRKLKHFKLDKLPYDLTQNLEADFTNHVGFTSLQFINANSNNFDPVYSALVLFANAKGNKDQTYELAGDTLKWLSLKEIRQADEQDGFIIGMDDLHLAELDNEE